MLEALSHIEYLLRKNDCVILPGFGAFIANDVPAEIVGSELLPPHRTITFNSAITHNDGLLANSIMRKAAISYDKDVRLIKYEVIYLNKHLLDIRNFDFGIWGKFQRFDDGRVQFIPNADSKSMASDLFGFRQLRLTRVDSSDCQTTINPQSRKADVVYLPINKNIFRIAVSIIILAILSIALSTPVALDRIPDYAGIIPAVPAAEKVVEESVSNTSDFTSGECAAMPIEGNTPMVEQKALEEDSLFRYYAVVASFKSKKQALRYVEESQLEGLKILDGRKIKRVYLFAGNSEELLRKQMKDATLMETNPDAWVYERRN